MMEEATVFFVPCNPPMHKYIMTLGGLKYNNTKNARGMVENLVCTTFSLSPEIRAIIEKKLRHPPDVALGQAMDMRASFLQIKERESMTRCWNIYFAGDPGLGKDNHKLLMWKMRVCTFNTIGFGKGYALTNNQPLCMGCKSADHDPYNCPFSKLPGWLSFRPGGQVGKAGEMDYANKNGTGAHPGTRGRAQGRSWGRGGYSSQRSRGTGQMSRGQGQI